MKKYKKYNIFKSKDQKGFTLIELILVIVVLGISVVPLTQLVTTNQKAVGDIALYVQAEFFTQSVMEEIIADYKSSARGYDWAIANWSGRTVNHHDLSITATVSIQQVKDEDTGIQYAIVLVGTKAGTGLRRTKLTCYLVDDGS